MWRSWKAIFKRLWTIRKPYMKLRGYIQPYRRLWIANNLLKEFRNQKMTYIKCRNSDNYRGDCIYDEVKLITLNKEILVLINGICKLMSSYNRTQWIRFNFSDLATSTNSRSLRLSLDQLQGKCSVWLLKDKNSPSHRRHLWIFWPYCGIRG